MRIFDHETLKYLAVNDAAVRLYGYTRREFLALTAQDTRHPEEHASQLATMAETTGYLRHRPPRRHVKKSGEIMVVDVVTQDILFDGRKARLSLTIDVTERERAEQALRESNEFLRSVIESSRDCIKVLDLEGRLESMNQGGQRLLEIDDIKPLLNKSWLEFWKDADREAAEKAIGAARSGGTGSFEGYCPSAKGTPKWWDVIITPIRGADGGPEKLLAVSRDITDRKHAEQERLAHAIGQRDALVREVHHRIKNSLQGVAGLLRQKITKYPAIAPGIEEAVAQLQSVALVYGLQETRPDGLLSLAEITNAICTSAESLIGGRVERAFERQSQRPACVAGAEAVSVAVALNELVFNALKHQPAAAGEKRARIVLHETADEAEIRITNRGQLPAGFDYLGGQATGSGLGLVRTLLAPPGGTVAFNGGPDEVEVVVMLGLPLLVERQKTTAR
ncbi:MAG: PAS domain S-box protein [Betaproteobacteria bacterium]|nr:PAS domain S-box protein [Betaproteobacteria bacterium]